MPASSFRLRNGEETSDRRLDRLVSFDERSKRFSAYSLGEIRGVGDKPPRTKHWQVAQILNQGAEGACAGFGVGGELAAEPVMVKGITNRFCREKIYWRAQRIDEWPGGSYPGADPQYEGTSVIAAAKAARELGYIQGFHWAFSLEETLYALSWLGPVVIGVNWYEAMGEADAQGFVMPTGRRMGGHCVYLCGNDHERQHVWFANSWGTSWGKRGMAKIRYADLEKLLNEQGEACVFDGRKKR